MSKNTYLLEISCPLVSGVATVYGARSEFSRLAPHPSPKNIFLRTGCGPPDIFSTKWTKNCMRGQSFCQFASAKRMNLSLLGAPPPAWRPGRPRFPIATSLPLVKQISVKKLYIRHVSVNVMMAGPKWRKCLNGTMLIVDYYHILNTSRVFNTETTV